MQIQAVVISLEAMHIAMSEIEIDEKWSSFQEECDVIVLFVHM